MQADPVKYVVDFQDEITIFAKATAAEHLPVIDIDVALWLITEAFAPSAEHDSHTPTLTRLDHVCHSMAFSDHLVEHCAFVSREEEIAIRNEVYHLAFQFGQAIHTKLSQLGILTDAHRLAELTKNINETTFLLRRYGAQRT